MWSEIFNYAEMERYPNLKKLMRKDFDYESLYYKVIDGPYEDEEKEVFSNAVLAAYKSLDNIVSNFRFTKDAPFPVNIYGVWKLISRFAGKDRSKGFFFTLNQDLFVERKYSDIEINLTLPGIKRKRHSKQLSGARLEDDDFLTLPTEEELETHKTEWLSSGKFHYIKLHGSYEWRSSTGLNRIVIGRGKLEQIQMEPLLAWYFSIFKNVLSRPRRRLLVIGYGFRDEHINQVIAKAMTDHGLELYVLQPVQPEDFRERLHRMPYGKKIWARIGGYFPYCLKDVFPADQSKYHAYGTLEKNYFDL